MADGPSRPSRGGDHPVKAKAAAVSAAWPLLIYGAITRTAAISVKIRLKNTLPTTRRFLFSEGTSEPVGYLTYTRIHHLAPSIPVCHQGCIWAEHWADGTPAGACGSLNGYGLMNPIRALVG
jgi:hypothetical protein